jgi:hypothetical protein
MMRFADLIPALQMAIGPVILISGIGLLLLSMTNRFGRVIDRTRQIGRELRQAPQSEADRFSAQLKMLRRRAGLLRWAIISATAATLMAALLISAIFLAALFGMAASIPVIVLFLGAMASLILSLVLFIQDLNLSLAAMTLEIEGQAG